MKTLFHSTFPSPVGQLTVISSEDKLLELLFEKESGQEHLQKWRRMLGDVQTVEKPDQEIQELVRRQLEEYFRGLRRNFTIPLRLIGTPFQLRVWEALRSIPYGETRSYQDIARVTGNPRAVRAVGTANGKNRIPIIIPCHRVINASGKLGGYGGGLAVKQWLLELESAR